MSKGSKGKSTLRVDSCPSGKAGFKKKVDAEEASRIGKATNCHRCRGWHPK